MDKFPPEFPDVDPKALRAIIDFTQQMQFGSGTRPAVRLKHGHTFDRFNATGWQFVADALAGGWMAANIHPTELAACRLTGERAAFAPLASEATREPAGGTRR